MSYYYQTIVPLALAVLLPIAASAQPSPQLGNEQHQRPSLPEVIASHQKITENGTFTFQRVRKTPRQGETAEKPQPSKFSPPTTKTNSPSRLKTSAAKIPLLAISATVVDRQITLLTWTHQGEKFQAWSSIDFSGFTGAHSLIYQKQHSLILLKTQEAKTKSLLPPLPNARILARRSFILISGDHQANESYKLVRAFHKHHINQLHDIWNYRIKQQQHKRRAKLNPSEPRDIVLRLRKLQSDEMKGAVK